MLLWKHFDLHVSGHKIQSVVAPPNEVVRLVISGQDQALDRLLRSYRDALAGDAHFRVGRRDIFERLRGQSVYLASHSLRCQVDEPERRPSKMS